MHVIGDTVPIVVPMVAANLTSRWKLKPISVLRDVMTALVAVSLK